MIRTYKYRLRPNKRQDETLDFLFWQARNLYNAALEQRITVYQETDKGINYGAQWAHFRDERNNNPDTFGMLNASSVQQMLRRLDKAFSAFFRRLKAGETPGFPRFKGRSRFKSVEYRYGDGCKLRLKDNGQIRFYIQNIGEVKVIYHRAIPEGAIIKHVVIKRVNGKWHVCLMLVLPEPKRKPVPTGSAIGIDMGLKSLLATSEGSLYDNPRWMKQSLAKLRVAQRRVSRREKRSKRWYKAVKQAACLQEKIANQRSDYWHKRTRELANAHSLIAIEDLNLKFMARNRHLSLTAHDAGLGLFTQLLAYKVEETGCQLVVVNSAYTTQMCSRCGKIVEKDLSVRVHECPDCGLELDRDVNAARNIRKKAFAPLGLSGQDGTWPVGASVS
jgi:putative transposase